ncbi:MAG TPA: sulfatase [Candidatus Latescibacteria bacterium]|nr:sulfatase [Candidatus Latescibacterota bacterium]
MVDKPNILFVLTDQMRSTAMGCTGVENVHTPNLDRLASQGTRFTNAISNTPACAPARATIFTGLHVLSHELVNNEKQVKLGTCTWAGGLTDAGYKCGYIGKWHMDGGARTAFTPPGDRRLGFDDYWAVANCTHSYMESFYYEDDDPRIKWVEGYEPVVQTDLALAYLERKAGEKAPFFLTLSWGTPHDPYQEMPAEHAEKYRWEDIEYLPNNSPYEPGEVKVAKRKMLAGYYAHITALDGQLGRLLQFLDETPDPRAPEKRLAETTIVVFGSDHGDMLGSHGQYFKSQPYKESTGVPLIMRWTGRISAGRCSDGPISLVDLMPSLLALSGVEIPPQAEGEDLALFILGDESRAQDSVWINFPVDVKIIHSPPFRGVVTRDHTYAVTREGPWCLFDNKQDPFQRNNLISWAARDSPEIVALQQKLQEKVDAWLQRTSDPFETGDQVSDRYQPGHRDGVLPQVADEEFRIALQARRASIK